MPKILSRFAGLVAAGSLVLSVGAGTAAAKVTTYQANGDTVSITTPSAVSTPVGTTLDFPVTVSVQGSSPLDVPVEYVSDLNGWGPRTTNGLSLQSGCWDVLLGPGQSSCKATLAWTPHGVGSATDGYIIVTPFGEMTANFGVTGARTTQT